MDELIYRVIVIRWIINEEKDDWSGVEEHKNQNVPVLAPRQRAVLVREMSQVDVDYDIILRGDQVHMDKVHWKVTTWTDYETLDYINFPFYP